MSAVAGEASVGAPPVTTGPVVPWPPDTSERSDFFHRVRTFPEEVARWRKSLLARIQDGESPFPGLPARRSPEETREAIDEVISFLREVARILALVHGTPDLGNKTDPVDELVYIILARKTREGAYQSGYEALRQRFASWDELLEAPRREVQRLVHSGGLPATKTSSLFGVLERIRSEFGTCTLEPARSWSDERLEAFLCSLPGISRKSAYCVMMYSMGRMVFPVDTHVGRVLARIEPYEHLGLSLAGLDHRQLQSVLADLVPPNLRHSLHVNLLVHGREVCRSPRPLCGGCEIRSFCATFRASEARRLESAGAPTMVDLFAGAGGLSEGFRRAGFRTLVALDSDPMARRTYWLNHPELSRDRLLGGDIRELKPGTLRRLAGRRVDVLIGAPPCQGFSHAGSRSRSNRTGYSVAGDDRNFLFESMVSAAIELRPRLFIMENVPGMQSARRDSLSFLEMAERRLQDEAGFRTSIWKLNACSVGVPQDRIRYFLVASRLPVMPIAPLEEYQDLRRADFDTQALPPITLDEATFDLPEREAGQGTAVEAWPPSGIEGDPRARRYLKKFHLRNGSRILYNHTVRYHNERDLELYALLKPGEDSIHALERYGRDDLMRYRRDVFDDKYARMRGDRPSKTIVSHLAKDGNGYIHPRQVRSISIREAARLQSFQDSYVFCGAPSDQWIQIGNAVPPVLGEAIARSFLRVLPGGRPA